VPNRLLSEEKREEYLRGRERFLTKTQKRELHRIEKASFLLDEYEDELGEDRVERVFSSLRRLEMEILLDERESGLETILNLLPDAVNFEARFG
jgi:hypothetical protein